MATETRRHSVLIIDDDRLLCEMASDFLATDDLKVMSAHTGKEGLELCSRHYFDVVLLDQKLPDGEGYALCPQIIAHSENVKIIFITAFPSFKNALIAIESGAFSYLTKPFELKELKIAIDKCLRVNELEKAEESLQYQSSRENFAGALIGESGSLASISGLIATAAHSSSPVLITGETGSGKSLVARLIHRHSGRRGPFMAINCSALPENLIESELFGYEKGAFSGAHATKKGLLEIAENGSVLLDEIAEMGFHLQAKLLGVLDEMQIRRIGGVISHPVQVRIMAATNVALEKKIKDREFREDLFYRLNVIRIHLPPLRERREDIPRLLEVFLREMAPQRKLTLSGRDLEKLKNYHWPGNVRELKNVIERAVIHSQGGSELQIPSLLPAASRAEESAQEVLGNSSEIRTMEEMQRRYAAWTVKKMNHNLTRSAKALGISLNTLKKKLSGPTKQ
jgi:DNA-binding NtrC family response regulator